jgi:hypothetical protein
MPGQFSISLDKNREFSALKKQRMSYSQAPFLTRQPNTDQIEISSEQFTENL